MKMNRRMPMKITAAVVDGRWPFHDETLTMDAIPDEVLVRIVGRDVPHRSGGARSGPHAFAGGAGA
jgi:hypothetical protein